MLQSNSKMYYQGSFISGFILIIYCNVVVVFKNTKTILFASLIITMVLPFSGMNFAQAQEIDPLLVILAEKTEKIQNRIDKLEAKDTKRTDAQVIVLKIKLANIIEAGEVLGYMTPETLNDPEASDAFYKKHPVYIDEDEIDDGDISTECTCDTVKGMIGFKYPYAFWTYDGYIAPTSYQNLYYQTENDVWGSDTWTDHDWVKPFAYVYSTAFGTKDFTVDVLIADKNYAESEDDDPYLIPFIAHRIELPQYHNFVPEDTIIVGAIEWTGDG